jgi:predicted NAD/FAD-binding protein
MTERKRIAVVGAGAAGISAAWLLSKQHEVTLFEREQRLGGHTHTIVLENGPDAGTPIDTGFIVCNDKTYPNFHRFLADLGVPWRWSDMSFGFWDQRSGLQYAGTDLNGLFAQRTNLLNPQFLGMLWEIRRFCQSALGDRESISDRLTLGEYLRQRNFGEFFIRSYVIPMGAAIWSTAAGRMLRFPARTFIDFFKNHGLLSLKDRPRWQTVVGGSHSYLKAFQQKFPGKIHSGLRIAGIERDEHKVRIRLDGDGEGALTFDEVVIATHADQVLPLLAKPTEEEERLFGAWRYEKNRVVLHWDQRVLPPREAAWASWNYVRESTARDAEALSMTYHMNRLQGLQTRRQYCVTLNRQNPIPDRFIIRDLQYTHPLFTRRSISSQPRIAALDGQNRTFYCGSYHGYGFHEDAVASAVRVAARHRIGWPVS